MPSTRRQKAKARRSREADIMSDVENLDFLLGNPRLTENRTDSDITSEGSFGHTGETNSQEIEIRTSSENANELRNEMNLRISQEMDGLMSAVNSQIQKAIHEAINTQILPQIQNTFRHVQNTSASAKNVRNERRNKGPKIWPMNRQTVHLCSKRTLS